jgi:hypothetical protein
VNRCAAGAAASSLDSDPYTLEWVSVPLPVSLVGIANSSKYAIVLWSDGGAFPADYDDWASDVGDPYGAGGGFTSLDYGSTWLLGTGVDFAFRTYVTSSGLGLRSVVARLSSVATLVAPSMSARAGRVALQALGCMAIMLSAAVLLCGCSGGGKRNRIKLTQRLGCSTSYVAERTDALGVEEIGSCQFRGFEISIVTFTGNGARNDYVCFGRRAEFDRGSALKCAIWVASR